MNTYTCYKCQTEHSTDNMVAYCASCVKGLESRPAAMQKCAFQAQEMAKEIAASLAAKEAESQSNFVKWRQTADKYMAEMDRAERAESSLAECQMLVRKQDEQLDALRQEVLDRKDTADECRRELDNAPGPIEYDVLRQENAALTKKLEAAKARIREEVKACNDNAAIVDSLTALLAKHRELLVWLNILGGLGLDKHERIRHVLSLTPASVEGEGK